MQDSVKKSGGKGTEVTNDHKGEDEPRRYDRNGKRLSVSTPDLVTSHQVSCSAAASEKYKSGTASRKLTALQKHILGKWGSFKQNNSINNNKNNNNNININNTTNNNTINSSNNSKRIENAQSENNISALPHHDLEFPYTSELISTKLPEKNGAAGSSCSRFKPIYQEWNVFRRGMKYQAPVREFSLYWVVLSVSPNKRFKLRLITNPEIRQIYIHWDTQIGIITYFDGIRTYKVECMTTVERHDIWCVTTGSQALQISCNFEPVAKWQLPTDHNFCVIQPIHFGGKYLLSQKDGLPPRKSYPSSTLLGGQLSLIELGTVCGTSSSSAEDIAPEEGNCDVLICFQAGEQLQQQGAINSSNSTMQETGSPTKDQDHLHSFTQPITDTALTAAASDAVAPATVETLPPSDASQSVAQDVYPTGVAADTPVKRDTKRVEDTLSVDHRDTNTEMVKVKQLSIDLICLISQLEADFKVNDSSFKQKINSLDCLSRNMVQTLRTMQRESRDSRAEYKRREAEQLNYTVALEERIGRLEDIINGSDYSSLSDGFTDVIQQYLDTDGFVASPHHTSNKLPNLKEHLEILITEMNEKLKSLNKRIKSDQSTLVKEMMFIKDTVERFRGKTQQVLLELELGVNSRIEHGKTLASQQRELKEECDERFLRVNEQLTTFEMKLNSLDTAVEELEQNQFIESEFSKTVQYETMGNLSDTTLTDEEASGSNILPVIQEDRRLEDLEQTCRSLMEQLHKQKEDIDALKEENNQIRSQFNNNFSIRTSSVTTEDESILGHFESKLSKSIIPENP